MLIVDKEMPESCMDCFMRMDCEIYRRWIEDLEVMRVPKREEHLQDCLIKGEIPDGHGDLIDREKLMPSLKHISEAEHQIYGNASWRFAGKCIAEVDSAHVVVPADKGVANDKT